jgi:hypothetical protein
MSSERRRGLVPIEPNLSWAVVTERSLELSLWLTSIIIAVSKLMRKDLRFGMVADIKEYASPTCSMVRAGMIASERLLEGKIVT